ncbi:MAG: deoxynucleoside kinase [Salinivirgaceae bacterium]|nr:deoxynucleoside kinase [Salinivirgaceae bacterium]
MELSNKYIVIEGNIGAGKTSLATRLADQYNGKLIMEQFHDNPFLPKFYSNPERYSFSLELSFLAARYKQLNDEISSTDLFKSFTIADYYFVKSLVFARTTLGEDEFALYRQLFQIIYQQLPLPDLYLYLHATPERLLQNIAKRGREYEKSITADYLIQIQKSYFNYFKTEVRFPIVVIETTHIDFVNNQADYIALIETILKRDYANGLNWVEL